VTTKPSYTIKYYATGSGSPYTLASGIVTGVTWNSGRRNITDNWNGGNCTIYGRSPSSFSPGPEIGKGVSVTLNDGSAGTFYGYIADYRIIYGLSTAYDTWELALESGYSAASRRVSDDVFCTVGESTYTLAYRINQASVLAGSGYSISYGPASSFGAIVSTQSWNGYLSDPITDCLTTEAGVLIDTAILPGGGAFYPTSTIYGHNATWTKKATFSDAADSNYRYNSIEFESSAFNYGSQVIVEADGLAAQTSGTGIYAQTFQTINGTTSDAANLAAYLKTKLDLATAVPSAISFTSGTNVPKSLNIGALCDPTVVGNYIDIIFRGTTYSCIIEGFTMSGNPTELSCTYYLSSSLQNAFLRLDDAVFGKLDTNKLGF